MTSSPLSSPSALPPLAHTSYSPVASAAFPPRRSSTKSSKHRKSLRFGENVGSPLSKEAKAQCVVSPLACSNLTRPSESLVLGTYQNVVKLCNENKVTTKNSWALNLIENIDTVLGAAKGSFHKASCALSAAVEIYAQRVDGTHADTFKMLETVLNSENRGEADGENVRESRRQTGNAATSATTLESNLANITCSKVDKEFDVDPLFRKILGGANNNNCQGLLLNTLGVHAGCDLVFDTSGLAAFDSDSGPSEPSSSSKQIYPLPRLDSRAKPLVPSMQLLADELARLASHSQQQQKQPPPPQLPAALLDPVEEEPDYAEPDFDYDDEDEHAAPEPPLEALFEAKPFSATSYFDPKRAAASRSWAGPSHWKFVAPRVPGNTASKADKEKKPRRRLDFSAGTTIPAATFAPPPRSAASTLLSKKAREARDEHLLPIDVHFNAEDLLKLFNKPHIALSQQQQQHANEEADVDNGGTAADYDEDDSGDFFDCDGDEIDTANLNLVAPAHHIERIRVAFATRAKRVDVKKLKTDLWGAIENEPQSEVPLSHTIHDLRPRVNDNVTVPFYFICMLHLANEKGLELHNSAGLDDVVMVRAAAG